jgi:hypothetical protein
MESMNPSQSSLTHRPDSGKEGTPFAQSIVHLIKQEHVQLKWDSRYGFRPRLLETFVEKARFTGTCYRAANWLHVGQTQGRGKLGSSGKQRVPIKDVWLYPLDKGFKYGLVR